MPNLSISIIIPIKVTKHNQYLLSRLENLLSLFDNINSYNVKYIIVDSSSDEKYKKQISNISSHSQYSSYYHLPMSSTYSAAKARNYGAYHSLSKYLLFYDVDLIIPNNFFDFLFQDTKQININHINKFYIYPCLYLDEQFTKIIEKQSSIELNFTKIRNKYLEGYNNEVTYLAVNTSTILVNKKHFFNIGAYNENYKGHGYEDFELIHRLYMAYPIVAQKKDYLLDFKTNFPGQYKGFRKYFSYYALPNFFKGAYTLHLWHPRPLSKKYYKHRKENAKFFITQLQHSLKEPLTEKYIDVTLSTNFTQYIDKLYDEYNIDKKKYFGLYTLNPLNITSKNKNSFQRKLRKLLLTPKQFFLDIKLNQND